MDTQADRQKYRPM